LLLLSHRYKLVKFVLVDIPDSTETEKGGYLTVTDYPTLPMVHDSSIKNRNGFLLQADNACVTDRSRWYRVRTGIDLAMN